MIVGVIVEAVIPTLAGGTTTPPQPPSQGGVKDRVNQSAEGAGGLGIIRGNKEGESE